MKKNQKGFTLVELIVVVALMTIIMGAVLSILRPVNEFYQKVNNTTHQEAACIAIGDSISDTIKYSRKVEVICTDSVTTTPSSSLKHYIKIDNTMIRSDSKQHAIGEIVQGDVGGSERTLRGFDVYSDAAYKISVSQNSNNASGVGAATDISSLITLSFEASPMKYDGSHGDYIVNNDIVYKYAKTIEFTNVNNRGMLENNNCSFSFSDSSTYQNFIYIFYNNPDET